ncbi:MAG: hypothetical protein KGL40_12775 [Rhodocyclaceae bacterium]|nr:hypothetical protein [Rhodocyclaceae bacterium]
MTMRFPFLILPLLLCACATTAPPPQAPDAYRADTFDAPPPGASLTLLPPQETQFDELREGAELLQKQLQKQLSAAGYKVTVLKKDDYVAQWNQEAAAVGGVLDAEGHFKDKEYREALGNLLRKTCEASGCAMLLDSRLVVRPAEIIDGQVEWDGRRIAAAEPSTRSAKAQRSYGISAEVAGIQPDGSLAFKNYGGTLLPPQYSMDDIQEFVNKPMTWSDADLSAGLRIALQPLFATPVLAPTPAPAPASVPAGK